MSLATAGPLITGYSEKAEELKELTIALPTVFKAPIKPDVNFVHQQISSNHIASVKKQVIKHLRIMENWSSCSPYSSCTWWRHPSIRSGFIRNMETCIEITEGL